jgi:predicted RNA-binding Zn ribbon-like protein
VNYEHYTDCSLALAADIVNEHPGDPETLRSLLERHEVSFVRDVTDRDVAGVDELRSHLREVFTSGDLEAIVALMNRLLSESGAQPWLTDHDGEPLHLHYERPDRRLADQVTADVVMGLAAVVVRDGLDRFRTCAAEDCDDVFVDLSRNRSRRFCDPETCGNRAHVAAHRARRRAQVESH